MKISAIKNYRSYLKKIITLSKVTQHPNLFFRKDDTSLSIGQGQL